MENLPAPITKPKEEGIIFTNAKEFNVENEEEKFKLKISTNEKLIFFEIEKINEFPKKDFNIYLSLEELGKINKFFNQFDTMSEVFSSLENLVKDKNILVKEEEKKMKLTILNPVTKKEIYIDVPLKEKDLKSEINSINSYISSLNNKISDLEKKVNVLWLFKEECENYLKQEKERKEKKRKEKERKEIERKEKERKEKEYINSIFKDSNIIENEDDIKLIISWLNKNPTKTNLLFNSQNDGDSLSKFFEKVSNKSPTIILVKSLNGYRFGGYSSVFWKNDNKWYKNDESFIFSLNSKKKYDSKKTSYDIYGYPNFVQFGNDIRIYDRFTSVNDNFVGKVYYNSPDNYEMNGGNQKFKVSNFEVYQIV